MKTTLESRKHVSIEKRRPKAGNASVDEMCKDRTIMLGGRTEAFEYEHFELIEYQLYDKIEIRKAEYQELLDYLENCRK